MLNQQMIKFFISGLLLNAGSLALTLPAFANSEKLFYSVENKSDNQPIYLIAESRRQSFTVTDDSPYFYHGYIVVKSTATGNTYRVYYGTKIGAGVGDTVTIIINNDRWTTIINERTGQTAGITRVD